jgi:hypothetical protein
MAKRGVSITVSYKAWNTATNAPATGDAAQHAVEISKDGATSVAATNAPVEIAYAGAGGASGRYRITLTAAEANAATVRVMPRSSTANVMCEDVLIVMESAGGARAVRISATSGGSYLLDAFVQVLTADLSTVVASGYTGAGTSPVGAAITLDDGTYKVRVRKAGYNFAASTDLVVSGDTVLDVAGTAADTSPGVADCQILKGYYLGPDENATAGMTVTARIAAPNTERGTGKVITGQVLTATTDGNGYAELVLARGCTFIVEAKYSGSAYLKKTVEITELASAWITDY